MRKIFRPAMSLMNHLEFSQKMIVMAFLFSLSLFAFMYLLIFEINRGLDFAEKERLGAEYNQSIINSIQHIQQHRGIASAFLSGDVSFKEKLPIKQSQIDDDIQAIDTVDKKLVETLKTTDRWNTLKGKWYILKKQLFSLQAKKSFDIHISLIRNILEFMAFIADESNLTLDPEIDSFYLMDTVVDKLPMATEYAGQIRALGAGAIVPKELTAQEKTHLTILSGLSRSALEGVKSNMDKIFQKNANLKDQLEFQVQNTVNAIHDALDMLDKRVIHAEHIVIEPSEYYETFTKAIDTGFQLHDVTTSALYNLLKERTDNLTREKNYIIIFALLSLLVLFYLFAGNYFSVMDSLSKLVHASRSISRGDLNVNISLEARDEMTLVANSFNDMAKSLAEFTDKLKTANKVLQGEINERIKAEKKIGTCHGRIKAIQY